MSKESPQYETPSAEDYFSDNTQGRKDLEFIRQTGATLGIVKAQRRRPSFKKRKSSIGQRIVQATIRKLSEAEFNAQLDKVNIPRPSDPLDMLPVVRDGVFPYISELLRQFGQGEWALRPRTFCILRILGCPEAMEAFVAMKRTDAFLPYNDRNLPDSIKGADVRSRFLRLQSLVLSSQHLNELEQEGGAHFNFRAPADDYFSSIRPLGQGGSGKVDEVYGTFSLKYFARKRIHRGISALQDQRALGSFEKELTALKAASHRHLVKLVSSYSDPTYVGLIMRPVADQDLKAYLRQKRSTDTDRNAQKQCLRTFFGCLSKALEYLHKSRILHKDIKPQNVLVKREDAYLTDFGTAKTLGEMSRSFSTGRTDEVTPRYCAPEVADQAPRGKPSDMWSMGCVFLEMATVLFDHTLEDMDAFYATNGTTSRVFWKNDEATQGWIQKLRSSRHHDDHEVLDWVECMLQESQTDRPTASQLVARIADTASENRFFCFNCLEIDDQDEKLYGAGSNKIHNPDILSGALLHSHMRHDSANSIGIERDGDHEDDTVTSKVLEDTGVVRVAVEPGTISEATNSEDSSEDEPTNLGSENPEQPIGILKGAPNEILDVPPTDIPVAEEHVSTSVSMKNSVQGGGDGLIPDPEPQEQPSLITPSTPKASKHVKFDKPKSPDTSTLLLTQRFSGLDEDRRPVPSHPVKESMFLDEQPIVTPEPLKPPPLNLKECHPLPKSTLVPSYILAGCNRFTMNEVRASDMTMGRFNLFVYGRLVFPSALRAFAAHSIQGVYSSIHQRRLVPSSNDWANVDVSVKHAAEAMTPARLKDYDAWRPSRMEFAALQEASRTRRILNDRDERGFSALEFPPPGEVSGFLILNVTEEVLRYCDLVFSSDKESIKNGRVTVKEDTAQTRIDALLQRKLVTVDVQLTSGEYRSVPSYTYVWSKGVDHLWHPWKPDDFIRGASFQQMCQIDSGDWREEETALAEKMKIGYALVGDELCSAILADDLAKLQDLLDNYDDVNARCRKYGTPLQAAVASGNEDMVRLLLHYGANPSSSGGKYGTPLIAATVGSRKSITRILLKHRADVFASNSQYVNALYQAVGHGDWALAEMLLEAGAWLSKDYNEIKDLALERKDRDLQALLLEYDVRDTQQYRLEEDRSSSSISEGRRSTDAGGLNKYGSVTKAVIKKFLVLSGESGSFRGRKGVRITRAALAAGAPPLILDHIRNAMDPVMKLIDLLKAADSQQEAKRKHATVSVGKVEEVESSEDDSAQAVEVARPSIRVSAPDEKNERPMSQLSGSPSSRRSSNSSVGSSRSFHSKDSPTPKKAVKFDDTMDPALKPSSPFSDSRYSEHELPKTQASTSRSKYYDNARPVIPRISIPASKTATASYVSPSQTTFPHGNSRSNIPTEPPKSPNLLHPQPTRRQRARSLDDPYDSHNSTKLQTHASSDSELSLPKSPSQHQWNSQSGTRELLGGYVTKKDEGLSNSKLRRSSDTPDRARCGKCNGLGWYREISGSISGRKRVNEVTCGRCSG